MTECEDTDRILTGAIVNSWNDGYTEGHEVGFRRGVEAGRSTLSRMWFFWVWLATFCGATILGLLVSLTILGVQP